ncbi:EF-hand domain pair,Kazal domain,SPARC/Testican, calcium-binding domain [Cinara cedri]|uniref:EF-hand domain pair,Kazal domain,SPARC/Testican, calcium-binding domain n=1 Tax=Cinara cedri TaxID=506608 RepID=A0A5E4MYA6_9HEMI|nr:EF-hand domain pair,Kazal domain,SPARC/Testican, calcium-binding domain [Cinara cedri]
MIQLKLFVGTLVLLVLCEYSISIEDKMRKTKKFNKNKSDGLPDHILEKILIKTMENELKINERPPENMEMTKQNPCQKKHCSAGRECKVNEIGVAECVCVSECPIETDDRRKVCSNYNETWGSDCEIYRMRCNCEEDSSKCQNPEFKHLHVEYYGACKQLPKCSDSEMSDFPRRMREWLYNIMQDLADREELGPHFTKMVKEAETNLTKRWSNAAVWKWCDLDGHPHDRAVSRHELFPIRAPLQYLEHCIAPFLNKCDTNNDHMVTLVEWGDCLEIPKDTLEEDCDYLRNELN